MIGPARGPSESIRVTEVRSGVAAEHPDEAATEEPLEIRVEASPSVGRFRLAVTMRTPGQDFELAAGFLYSEGLVRDAEDVRQISYCTDPGDPQQYNIVNVALGPGVDFDPERYRRNVYTTSSCGLCGKAAIEEVAAHVRRRPVGNFRIAPADLGALPGRIGPSQRIFGRTGGIHAAALFRPTGELLLVREDVGRHNALDKVVGARLLGRALPDSNSVLLVTGRAGFELVQKAAMAGVPFLAAIGAPSSLAISLAEQQGMTLVGFLRPERFVVYAGAERIAADSSPAHPVSGT